MKEASMSFSKAVKGVLIAGAPPALIAPVAAQQRVGKRRGVPARST